MPAPTPLLPPQVKQRRLTSHSCTWTYLTAGQGPPLVWLHGLWGEPGWEPHHQLLAEHYTVYAPALPGYTGTTCPEWLSDMEDVATLIVDLLDALGLHRPILAGHSLGGWAAAETVVFRPDRLSGIVLIDPLGVALDWTQLPDVFYIDPARLPALFFADPSLAAARQYFPPPAEWDERFLRNREASVRLAFHPYLHSRRLQQRLRFVSVPALVVWGEHDYVVSPEHAQVWHACLPRAEVSIVKRAGHFPHVEQADACLPSFMEFVHRITQTTEAGPR